MSHAGLVPAWVPVVTPNWLVPTGTQPGPAGGTAPGDPATGGVTPAAAGSPGGGATAAAEDPAGQPDGATTRAAAPATPDGGRPDGAAAGGDALMPLRIALRAAGLLTPQAGGQPT